MQAGLAETKLLLFPRKRSLSAMEPRWMFNYTPRVRDFLTRVGPICNANTLRRRPSDVCEVCHTGKLSRFGPGIQRVGDHRMAEIGCISRTRNQTPRSQGEAGRQIITEHEYLRSGQEGSEVTWRSLLSGAETGLFCVFVGPLVQR